MASASSVIFTDCRDRGHAWLLPSEMSNLRVAIQTQAVGYQLDQGVVERVLVCIRCGTERHESFARRGDRIKHAKYRYPDGYLIKGEGRHGRDEYRSMAVKAALKALKNRSAA